MTEGTLPPSFSPCHLFPPRGDKWHGGNPVIKSLAFRFALVLQSVIALSNPERRIALLLMFGGGVKGGYKGRLFIF